MRRCSKERLCANQLLSGIGMARHSVATGFGELGGMLTRCADGDHRDMSVTNVRNAWYVAAWSHDLVVERPARLRMLDEPIVIWRNGVGRPDRLRGLLCTSPGAPVARALRRRAVALHVSRMGVRPLRAEWSTFPVSRGFPRVPGCVPTRWSSVTTGYGCGWGIRRAPIKN